MLTLEGLRARIVRLPLLVRIGLVILLLGGLADVVAHVAVAGHAEHLHEHTASQLSAHLIGFVGIFVILLGGVLDGARRTYRRGGGGHSTGPTRPTPSRRH